MQLGIVLNIETKGDTQPVMHLSPKIKFSASRSYCECRACRHWSTSRIKTRLSKTFSRLSKRSDYDPSTPREPAIPDQSSHIVSRFRSPLLSAPHTLHRFRLSLPKLVANDLPRGPGVSFVFESSPLSAASASAFNCAIRSASCFKAASSASGESSIVSRDEMEGLRDLAEVAAKTES
jgi:hypothetical protein